jgi:hypothetical protein
MNTEKIPAIVTIIAFLVASGIICTYLLTEVDHQTAIANDNQKTTTTVVRTTMVNDTTAIVTTIVDDKKADMNIKNMVDFFLPMGLFISLILATMLIFIPALDHVFSQ